MSAETTPVISKKSSFVTGMAWIMIVMSAFGIFITLLQTIFFFVLIRVQDLEESMSVAMATGKFPKIMAFPILHIRSIAVVMLLVFLTLFVVSVGFLRRKEWGRKGVVLLCWVNVACNALGSVSQYFVTKSVFEHMSSALQLPIFFTAVNVAAYALSLLFTIGLLVLIKRLNSRELRNEFGRLKINEPFQLNL